MSTCPPVEIQGQRSVSTRPAVDSDVFPCRLSKKKNAKRLRDAAVAVATTCSPPMELHLHLALLEQLRPSNGVVQRGRGLRRRSTWRGDEMRETLLAGWRSLIYHQFITILMPA